ncbi:xanthine dehydrogenase family protein molybdopterin-binding subunit [Colwellia sp. C1TZA3]|uniref:xanthine dehydrogenase family protein molybdopterin-binding subunit n=1 Tax=Colwellia sp. C1TZA3 TaxID=2508879 RepID=UPI0011B9589A|nr:molybdopterin cofactor-binding domain-containing protein [Colwellia sp. C1TZA3]TWX72809.1 xanthine dehydrogenase family protein molybdopterin-binding subunit [Colwellia sp. C1TZA3]
MKHIENVSRRGFLKTLGISSTALVLGVQLPSMLTIPKALAGVIAADKFSPNVYVQIGSDNMVSIVVHRSEMGQGIKTSIPMIVADELGADWQKITVVQGLGDKKYGSQNTDGSRSVRRFYQPLREAGAAARMMLQQAAAKQWQVDVSQTSAVNNTIVHEQTGRTLSFGSLVAIASTLALPAQSALILKDKKDFTLIGKSDVALVDGEKIAIGATTYGFDVELDQMQYAVIARPPVLGAKVKSFNSDAAKAIAGVIDVVQLPDLEEPAVFKPLGGVAVIAKNTWAAMKGREALAIQWHESTHQSYNSDDYKKALAKSCDNPAKVLRSKGDVSKALVDAKQVITASYYVPELIHVPMEPPAAAAHFHDGIFDIWACTQTPQSAQSTVAQITGIAPENVNINVTLLGGGFGRKSKPDFIVEAAILSKQLNVPIKVMWTREDEIQNGYYHAVSYQKLAAGIDEDGTVTAWQHHVAEPPIGSTFSQGEDLIGSEADLGLIDMPYDIANVSCAAGKAPAHTRIGWMRSVTNINHVFAVSSFVDELAQAKGLDSKDNLIAMLGADRKIDFSKEQAKYGNYGETLAKFPVDTARMKAVIEKASTMAKWGRKLPKGHGLGIAMHRSFVSYVACIVEVSENSDGKIKVDDVWMAVDCGLAVNPERIRSQMEGAAIFALSLTFFSELTAKDGVIEQNNFDSYQVARIADTPTTHVEIIDSDAPPGGVGEPGVPPIAPAICNAIFNATGKRYRELPLKKYGIV